MKHHSIAILLFVLSALSQAAVAYDFDSKSELDQIVKITDAGVKSQRKSFVFLYNARRFNAEIEAAELSNDYNKKTKNLPALCNYNIVIGSREATDLLKTDSRNEESTKQIAAILESLYERGQLKTIITVAWDGRSGDVETCSKYQFDAYSVDGYKLSLFLK